MLVPLPGTVRATVNVSLYELAMLPVAVVGLAALRTVSVSPVRLFIFLVPVPLIALHSLYAALAVPDIAMGDLAKETIKYIEFFVFTLALSIFMTGRFERRAVHRLITLALLAVLIIMLIDWARYYGAGHGVPGGSLAAHAAIVLLYLFIATGEGPRREAPESWAIPIAAIVLLGIWGTKLFIGLGCVIVVWGLLAPWLTGDPHQRLKWLIGLSAVLLLSAGGLALWWELAAPYGRSLSLSISERIGLWSFAWELIQTHWPWGIGLGQYAAKAAAEPGVIDFYAHNTFVGAVVELGLLGCVFMGFLLAAIVISIGAGPHLHLWIALLIAIGPMLLQDVLSFRSLQILLAVGLAGLLSHDNARPNRFRSR